MHLAKIEKKMRALLYLDSINRVAKQILDNQVF